MGRSGYAEDWDGDGRPELYRNAVERAFRGKRGRAFLETLAKEMDAMPAKRLIAGDLVTPEGECCAMGVVCKARGLDVSGVDCYDADHVAKVVGLAPSMVRDIAFENDDDFGDETHGKGETPEQRWVRMRKWVEDKLVAAKGGGG